MLTRPGRSVHSSAGPYKCPLLCKGTLTELHGLLVQPGFVVILGAYSSRHQYGMRLQVRRVQGRHATVPVPMYVPLRRLHICLCQCCGRYPCAQCIRGVLYKPPPPGQRAPTASYRSWDTCWIFVFFFEGEVTSSSLVSSLVGYILRVTFLCFTCYISMFLSISAHSCCEGPCMPWSSAPSSSRPVVTMSVPESTGTRFTFRSSV